MPSAESKLRLSPQKSPNYRLSIQSTTGTWNVPVPGTTLLIVYNAIVNCILIVDSIIEYVTLDISDTALWVPRAVAITLVLLLDIT